MRIGARARLLIGLALLCLAALALPGRATAAAPSQFTLTPSTNGAPGTGLTGKNQGFSVESADLANGSLNAPLLTNWLRTLGPHGLIRVGGFSVDDIWPAFGSAQNTPAPAQAVGGTVNQADLDSLKQLLDATGWKATVAVPLKSVINTDSSSLTVPFDQAVAYAVAVKKTLGSHLQAVEVGNESNLVTSLTPDQYHAWMVKYYDAINAADAGSHVQVVGPSATKTTSTYVPGMVSALQADTSVNPREMMANFTSHNYESARCGLDAPGLLSANTYANRQSVLQNYVAAVGGLNDGMPAVLNETNSEAQSGCAGVSNTYASALWSLDYQLQAAQDGVQSMNFHTSTAQVCGNFQTSPTGYTTSYRWYAAFCAPDQSALNADQLSAAPLYYGIW
ncbi:MAG: hypothetical protein J2O48_08440, partial [Solirubrobacterales bacterium]|nr:hypothetical protein [Solirubrobacterales bacterium]